MNIIVTMVAYNEATLVRRAVESIFHGTKNHILLYLYLSSHYNSDLIRECDKIAKDFPCKYYPYGVNTPILFSNDGFYNGYYKDGADLVVNTAPDVIFNKSKEFDHFLNKAFFYKDSRFMISNLTCVYDYFPYACCILTKKGIDIVGYNDENFLTSFSDTDWNRRAALLTGENPSTTSSYASFREDIITDSTHVTKNFFTNKHTACTYFNFISTAVSELVCGPLSREYYVSKWGGDFSNEKYMHPFNDNNIGLKISYEQVRNPYPQKQKNKITFKI